MSEYYAGQRSRGLYAPDSTEPFKLSRTKIELFTECPRCFYLDRRLGVGRPPGFPFALNAAVDKLLKLEFDIHRVKGTRHPLIEKYGVDAQPVPHKDLDDWRNNFVGVQFLHKPTNFLVFGAIDDLWQNSRDEYIVVDYKATSKSEDITELNKKWQDGYKRQMEVYQWLLRKNGYTVSDTGYFVYCNGRTDRAAFDGKLEFDVTLIPYEGDDSWVEDALEAVHQCLNDSKIPESGPECDHCTYFAARTKAEAAENPKRLKIGD
ncbi:MAG: PD-(D/E)XK nuclease family protein [Candidatus Niyogibacteria bacterium]|nr:PD-(D/E)XK nuclease family protein [Candidatus Niyogibacteria bacterium]